MYIDVLHTYICFTMYVPGASKAKKIALDPLELRVKEL